MANSACVKRCDGHGRGRVEQQAGVGVQQPQAVGPDQPHSCTPGDVHEFVLQGGTGRIDLTEACGDDHAAANLPGSTLQDGIADRMARYCNNCDVNRIVQLVERRNSRQVENLLAPGIDRDDLAGKSAVQRVV